MSENAFSAHPSLLAAQEELKAAQAYLKRLQAHIQESCEHKLVVQNPSSGDKANYRVCARCRLVERGSHWSYRVSNWSVYGGERAVLDNRPDRIVVQMSGSDTIYSWENDMAFADIHHSY